MGMSNFPEPGPPLRTLPLYTAAAEEARKLFPQQRRVLEQRAEYVRAQLARDREARAGNALESELDPVLRFHLGLEKKD
jgi:hypothetical protein